MTGPIQNLTVSTMDEETASLQWQPPLYKTSTVMAYRVEYRIVSQSILENVTISGTTYTVIGLTAGTPYELRVTAINSIGSGSPTLIVIRTGTHNCHFNCPVLAGEGSERNLFT